jgi:hypothetical protein
MADTLRTRSPHQARDEVLAKLARSLAWLDRQSELMTEWREARDVRVREGTAPDGPLHR